ncbi:hypothetical protein HC823_02470 [Candidatus Gracilibacteria bacterium]|nr:hypothetical protein [Candidatus Gracilibacteria bacterium]
MNDQYLLVLGRNFELSRAEAKLFCDEIFANEKENLLLAQNLRFENPREIPVRQNNSSLIDSAELFVWGKCWENSFPKKNSFKLFSNTQPRKQKTTNDANSESRPSERVKIFCDPCWDWFGAPLRKIKFPSVLKMSAPKVSPVDRFLNEKFGKKDLSSGSGKMETRFSLRARSPIKTFEIMSSETETKPFAMQKWGCSRQKSLQILINLADPKNEETIIDPFCGSGTVNSEAAIMGYQTIGSDLSEKNVKGSIENFAFLAEKFRYEEKSGEFFESNATEFPWDKHPNAVMATEGWLGHNFTHRPTKEEIQRNSQLVIDMWNDVFNNMKKSGPRRIALCIPAWQYERRYISFHEKIFAKISHLGYTPLALFGDKETFLYAREGAFVAREICVLERNPSS